MDLIKTDPYPNLVKYSLDVLKKKTKVLDIINTGKTCFIMFKKYFRKVGD